MHEFPLPWSQITRLYINHHIKPHNLYAVFSITPNLQFLRMSGQNEDDSSSAWDPDESNVFIVCSTLRHLDVADPALFRAAILPSLEEISIDFLSADEEDDDKYGADLFHDFLHRSQCPMRKLTIQLGEDFDAFERIFDQHPGSHAWTLHCKRWTQHRSCLMLGSTPKSLPQLQSLKVVYIAWEAYNQYDDADLGEGIAGLFISRYLTFAADILSVHVEVVLGGKMVANPLRPYERTPDGPFLSEPFWKSFENHLRDAPELRSRMVTEKKEHRESLGLCDFTPAILLIPYVFRCHNMCEPSHYLIYDATDLSYITLEYLPSVSAKKSI